jgi:choice-of-anchor C domain-containing protein
MPNHADLVRALWKRAKENSMKHLRTFVQFATMTIAILAFCPERSFAGLIVNGSFEEGTDPGAFTDEPVGSTNITGWSVINNSVDYTGTQWPAADGLRSIDLNGTELGNPGGVAQTFTTIIGDTYLVSFAMAGNPGFGNGDGIKTLSVSADGQSGTFSFDTTGHNLQNLGWVTDTWSFTATGTSTTLAFNSLTENTNFGPTLDNVIVTAMSSVPEPSSAIMLSLAFASLNVMAVRRRKHVSTKNTGNEI